MLDKIDTTKKIDKADYKEEIDRLEEKLNELHQKIQQLKIPVMLVFEGWSAAGKGTLINKILRPLDPRYFNVYTMNRVSEESSMRPILWSYWTKTPSGGRITIFDKSYHRITLPKGNEKWHTTEKERAGFYYDINAFEQQLANNGTLIIKYFIHISRQEQKKRIEELLKNPSSSWRIDQGDIKQNKEYDTYLSLFDNMILETNNEISLWNIIEGDDTRYAAIKVLKILIDRLEYAINSKTSDYRMPPEYSRAELPNVSALEKADLSKTISDKDYKEKLKFYQKKMRDLGYKMYAKRKSAVIVYEGWDAAGKGGNIKRLTGELDPRGYEVIPIAAPTSDDLDHHYLWRFWNKMPKDGHLTIFDRSWYGRVMVERVEGLCTEDEWKRAYKEMNDMERHIYNNDTLIIKFWIHIDKDEQLKRFNIRQNNPLKQYKITDEDWRNREKWEHYEKAVDEMLIRTDTDYAPWIVVESNSKKYARIKVLEIVCDMMEKHLK